MEQFAILLIYFNVTVSICTYVNVSVHGAACTPSYSVEKFVIKGKNNDQPPNLVLKTETYVGLLRLLGSIAAAADGIGTRIVVRSQSGSLHALGNEEESRF